MNLLDLFVKIGVDDQASSQISKITSGLGKGLATAAKIGTAAVGAAAAGITALTTAAVNNYAEYEQLVGGVETLFSKSESAADSFANSIKNDAEAIKEFQRANNLAVDGILGPQTMAAIEAAYGNVQEVSTKAADMVMEYAANAYKTAGLSANEYMETVTSFSASLLQSLGGDTEAAAEYADRAVTDMSDNANKMGTSMEMIQNAYQGFAKQNYTMLDNLKLGYGGTKTEMERLVADAAALTDVQAELGVTVDANSLSFGNIVNAISVMQEKMGIAGTTTEEASRTISGSINAMKGAWSNLITGIANDQADFDSLIGNMVDSAGAFAKNIIPRIEVTLGGIGQLIEKLAPIIVEQLPPLVDSILPMLISTATGLVNSFTTILPSLVKTIVTALVNNAPLLVKAGVSLINSLLDSIVDNKKVLLDGAVEIVNELVNGIGDLLPEIIEAGFEILTSLLNGIGEALPDLISKITDIIIEIALALTSPTSLTYLLEAGLSIIMGLAQGILDSIPALIEALPLIIDNIIRFLISAIPMLLEAAIMLFSALIDAIPSVLDSLIKALPQIITSLIDFVLESIPELLDAAIMLYFALVDAIPTVVDALMNQLPQILTAILDALVKAYPKLFDAIGQIIIKLFDFIKSVNWFVLGKNIILTVWNGLKSMWNNVITWFETAINGIFSGIVGLWNKVAEFAGFKKIGTDGALVDLSFMKADISTEGIDWSGIIKDSGYSNSVTINQNIYSEAKTAADLAEESIFEARRATTMAAWG